MHSCRLVLAPDSLPLKPELRKAPRVSFASIFGFVPEGDSGSVSIWAFLTVFSSLQNNLLYQFLVPHLFGSTNCERAMRPILV